MLVLKQVFSIRRVLSWVVFSGLLFSILVLPHLTKAAVLSPEVLPTAMVNTYYEQRLVTSSTIALPISWSISSGALPGGLTLSNPEGYAVLLKGTPTTVGVTSFRVTATGALANANSLSYTFTVSNPFTIVALSLPTVRIGTSYDYTFSAAGGTGSLTWNIVSGSLPSGLVFDGSTGHISGTALSGSTSVIGVRAMDAAGAITRRDFTLTVAPSASLDTDLAARIANFSQVGLGIHALVKLPSDGDTTTQYDSAVYYLGQDGRRHAFPNSQVYFSWYDGFSSIQTVDAAALASIPLGQNVTYHPGVKLVKFLTDNNVYAVAANQSLRWVKSESVALYLYGDGWRSLVDDIQDTFYNDYEINLGNVIMNTNEYSPSVMRSSYQYPSQVLAP